MQIKHRVSRQADILLALEPIDVLCFLLLDLLFSKSMLKFNLQIASLMSLVIVANRLGRASVAIAASLLDSTTMGLTLFLIILNRCNGSLLLNR